MNRFKLWVATVFAPWSKERETYFERRIARAEDDIGQMRRHLEERYQRELRLTGDKVVAGVRMKRLEEAYERRSRELARLRLCMHDINVGKQLAAVLPEEVDAVAGLYRIEDRL